MKQHTNLCSDLSKIVEQDPIKFRKVRDDVLAVRETFFDTTIKKGKIEGRKEGRKEGLKEGKIKIVINMMKDNLSDEIISNYSEFTLEEIAEIRQEHLNQ